MSAPGIDPHVFPLMPPKSIEHRLAHFIYSGGTTYDLALGCKSHIDAPSARSACCPTECSLGCIHAPEGSGSLGHCDDCRSAPCRPDSHPSFPIGGSIADCCSGHRHDAVRRIHRGGVRRTPLARDGGSASSYTPVEKELPPGNHRSLSLWGLVTSLGISSGKG